jgi:hypothetical protein
MDFQLSTEQKEMKEMVMKFAKNEMIPKAQHYDEEGIFPMEEFKKAWELGLINTCILLNSEEQVLLTLTLLSLVNVLLMDVWE